MLDLSPLRRNEFDRLHLLSYDDKRRMPPDANIGKMFFTEQYGRAFLNSAAAMLPRLQYLRGMDVFLWDTVTLGILGKHFSNLVKIDFSFCNVNPAGFGNFVFMRQLRELILKSTYGCSWKLVDGSLVFENMNMCNAVEYAVEATPSLRYLSIDFMRPMPTLQTVSLRKLVIGPYYPKFRPIDKEKIKNWIVKVKDERRRMNMNGVALEHLNIVCVTYDNPYEGIDTSEALMDVSYEFPFL